MKRIAIRAHRSTYPDPISFDAGDSVAVGGRDSEEYPGWIWTRTVDGNAGWAPESILQLGDGGTARAAEAYTARELDTETGDVLDVIRELSGWYWVRNRAGDEGWIPVETAGPIPAVPDRVKLDLTFDPRLLQEDLDRLHTGGWIDHFVTQNYEGDWSVIPLRGPAAATHPVMMIYSDPTCTEFADTAFLEHAPYFRRVLGSFQCPLQAARLMKLGPGSRIKEHTDHDLAVEDGTARLHIPVVTNDEVDFRLNGTTVVMREGECWYLRLSDPHSVENRGRTDRVHLVIDALVDAWLSGQLSA